MKFDIDSLKPADAVSLCNSSFKCPWTAQIMKEDFMGLSFPKLRGFQGSVVY